MHNIINDIYKSIDYILSLLLSSIFTCLAILLHVMYKQNKFPINKKAISIPRFREATESVLLKQSAPNLTQVYTMDFFKYTIIPFIGSEREKKICRVGKKLIFINIPLRRLPLHSALPNTESIIRYALAAIIQYRIIKSKKINYLISVGALNRMWNFTILRWLLPVKLIAQVRGNFDLTRISNEKLKSGFSYYHFIAMAYTVRYKFMAQLFYRSCDCIIGYNINNFNSAVSNGAHPQKTYILRIMLHNSMRTAKTIPITDYISQDDKSFIISLWSRLDKEKLVKEAILSALPFLTTHRDSKLIIIGDGAMRRELEELVAKAGISNQVIFCGRKNHDFIKSVAELSNVVLAPYSGRSLIEAAYLSCPVIAFDIEWHNELIHNQENGWIIDYHTPNKVSDILFHIYKNPSDGIEKGKLLHITANRMFDPTEIKNHEFEILNSLSNSSHS